MSAPYKFDPRQELFENFISGEVSNIVNGSDSFVVIVPKHAPFFKEDFALYHNGNELVEGVDFYLNLKYGEMTHVTAKEVYGGFLLINEELTGELVYSYHVVGSDYSATTAQVNDYLANRVVNYAYDDWTDLLQRSPFVPDVHILFDRDAWFGVSKFTKSIDDISVSVNAKISVPSDLNEVLTDWADDLEAYLDDADSVHSTRKNNPHSDKWYHASALKSDGIAQNTNLVGGKSIADITLDVYALGVQSSELSIYALLGSVNTFTGDILLSMNTSGINAGDGYITLSSEKLNIVAGKSIDFIIDLDESMAGATVRLKAGDNELKVTSNADNVDDDALTYNDKIIAHAGNVMDHVSSINPITIDVVTIDTASIVWEGTGKPAAPLKAHAVMPVAAIGSDGITKLSDRIDLDDDTIAATPSVAKTLTGLLSSKVANTVTINGKRINRNINITKSDIDLNNVANIADANLPMNSKHYALLSDKSGSNHTHTPEDLGLPTATSSTYGVTLIAQAISSAVNDRALSLSAANELYDDVVLLNDILVDVLPKNALDVTKYGKGEGIAIGYAISGWVLTIGDDVPFYATGSAFTINSAVIDINALYPTVRLNNTFYLYAELVNGEAVYVLRDSKTADNTSSILIGTVTTGAVGITNVSISNQFRLGTFREFEEHVNSVVAHGINRQVDSSADLGLDIIENKPIKHDLVIPTFKEVFDTWERFSHNASNVFPANPSELTKWAYDEATDSIRNTTNSSTYIGMVSPITVGDYSFITEVSSSNSDDDWIGVVIAYVVDENGRPHTLDVLCSGTDTRTQHAYVARNWALGTDPFSGVGSGTIASWTTTQKYGWDDIPPRIIDVKREGDIFTINISGFRDVAPIVDYVLDLNSSPELAIFKDSNKFGYSAQSQAYSTWKNINRPDSDSSGFYASRKLLTDITDWNKRVKVVTGEVSISSTVTVIPYPVGLNKYNVHFWASLTSIPDGGDGLVQVDVDYTLEDDGIHCTVASNTDLTEVFSYTIIGFNDLRIAID